MASLGTQERELLKDAAAIIARRGEDASDYLDSKASKGYQASKGPLKASLKAPKAAVGVAKRAKTAVPKTPPAEDTDMDTDTDTDTDTDGEIWECENGCGFRGTFSAVDTHEAMCSYQRAPVSKDKNLRERLEKRDDVAKISWDVKPAGLFKAITVYVTHKKNKSSYESVARKEALEEFKLQKSSRSRPVFAATMLSVEPIIRGWLVTEGEGAIDSGGSPFHSQKSGCHK
jgi:hypothetical protein